MKLRLLPLLLALVLSSMLVLPDVQAQFDFNNPQSLRPWVSLIVGNNQFPDSWLIFPNVIYYLMLPFIAIVAVVYGIISDLRIFKYSRWVRGVLAVAMAGMTLPSGVLIQAVYSLYSIDAALAALAFGVVFFLGVILWAVGTFSRNLFGTVGEIQTAKRTNSMISELDRDIRDRQATLNNLNEMIRVGQAPNNVTQMIDNLQGQIRDMEARKKELKRASEF